MIMITNNPLHCLKNLYINFTLFLGTSDFLFGVILILLVLFLTQDMVFTLYKIYGYSIYIGLLHFRPPFKFKYLNYGFSFITSPLLFSGKKFVLVYIVMMVFLLTWKYLGLKMNSYDERELLNITEYLFIFYALYRSIRLFITLVKLFIVEALKIIQPTGCTLWLIILISYHHVYYHSCFCFGLLILWSQW